ncbi:cysteine dioxygenase [Metabacillus sediminilitoris]|uniref:Cysteine dioxygenase n=1 Tax=Metabacillus sediminilitoris TaxID=2567941 RepID=A0A4S4C3W1_9BACI|nr:cysteine dioxygenase family protein [Metabacillus sediminilitoris]QGQ45251.1 cysteine dioxygenase [Metabacillus sediminilitoris]THF82450.1 cysteine dioxygenase [Metabacillus sediminilitoris]
MAFLSQVKEKFSNLSTYNHQSLAFAVKELDPKIEQISDFLKQPENLEYGRNVIYKNEDVEVIIVYFPAMAKTLVHDHGTSIGCIAVVEGDLLNVVYKHKGNISYPLYEGIQNYSKGDVFHVTGDTIHMMFNPTLSPVVTFHVYSSPLNGGRIYTDLTDMEKD